MATSSITANFYCDDAKAANAFVRMLVSPVKDSPSRRARAQLLDFETEAEKRDFVRRFRAKWSNHFKSWNVRRNTSDGITYDQMVRVIEPATVAEAAQ